MREALAASQTTSTSLPGLGTVLAAKVLGHIGDVTRFPTEHHFASHTGSAPLDASSHSPRQARVRLPRHPASSNPGHLAPNLIARTGPGFLVRPTPSCGSYPDHRMLDGIPDVPASDRGGTLTSMARTPLEGGGSVLVETAIGEGPVKAGRIGDAIGEVPQTLQEALEPSPRSRRQPSSSRARPGPDRITVEFGVGIAVGAGAVITKSRANCHLRVSVPWKNDDG
ncbi:CU044_2847 family protein [Streptomyces wedmorensis]